MRIGERIKQRREELGLSVEDLGKLIGKNRTTVYRYENGDIENLPTSVLEPVARALQTTPAHLMGWEEEPNGENPSIPTQEDEDWTKEEREAIELFKAFIRSKREQ